jgi:hypothetical protein
MGNDHAWSGFRRFIGDGFSLTIYSEDIEGVWPAESIIDIDITVNGLSKFTGMVCTINGVLNLMAKDEHTGENEYGSYFFIPHLLIVKTLDLKLLLSIFKTLILNKELEQVFARVENIEN